MLCERTGETPESLKRKREVAEALLRRGATAMPQDLPQGLVAVAHCEQVGNPALTRLGVDMGPTDVPLLPG